MKKLLAFITLVALIAFCTLFTRINTAAAPIETAKIGEIQASSTVETVAVIEEEKPVTPTLAERIVYVIEQIETQGHPNCGNIKGGSGEKGCLQFQPATWRAYSSALYGEVLPITPEREREVAVFKVQQWLDAGYSPRQTFLFWNQGNPSPCKSGVNKFGVRFDSCAYANKGIALLGSER